MPPPFKTNSAKVQRIGGPECISGPESAVPLRASPKGKHTAKLEPARSKAHELLTEGVDLRPQLTCEFSLCGARRGGPQWAEEVDERGRGLAARLGLVVEGHAELVLVRLVVARHLDTWGRSLEA